MQPIPAAIVLFLSLGATAPAQHHLFTFNGDSAGDRLGPSVSGAGDVNRDGFPDLIVGAPFDDNNGTDSGSARVLSGKDGSILYTFDGDSAGDEFGFAVSGAGDVNNDGFADLIVGAPLDDNKGTDSGSAKVLSGKDGTVLYTFNGDSADDRFGASVAGAGDVNGDGHEDLIVGAFFDDNNGIDSGSAKVFSGKDGTALYTFNGNSAGDRFGSSVSSAGDVNADSFADLIVGAYHGAGSATVFSGKDGKILLTFNGDSPGDRLGSSVSGVGDVNSDAFADVVVGASHDDNKGADSGSAKVFSGKDGKLLYAFNGNSAGDHFGSHVSGAGDVNSDGFPDLIVGAPDDDINGTESGSASVLSGKDGTILYTFNGDSAGDQFGSSVSGAGDVNGDGWADLMVGAWVDDNNGTDSGSARVLSGKQLALWSDVHRLSLNMAGTQKLTLDAGTQHAGRLYWIFGSATGTIPGISLAGVHIPLNPDLYTDVVIANTNGAVFTGFRGTLDINGQATASINIPASLPAMVGFTAHHAFIIHDIQGVVYIASNPVSLLLKN